MESIASFEKRISETPASKVILPTFNEMKADAMKIKQQQQQQ